MKLLRYIFIYIMICSCTKEIDIDYHSVASMPVIEAHLNETGVVVGISRTRDIDDNEKNKYVDDAVLCLSSSIGDNVRLNYADSGKYVGLVAPIVGVEYTLDVDIDGTTYTANSTMQPSPIIESARFKVSPIFTSNVVSLDFEVQTPTNMQYFYVYQIYRNGKLYKWNTFENRGSDNGRVTKSVLCFYIGDAENDEDEIIADGDAMTLSIACIERKAYEYLYGLKMSARTTANPASMFSGDAIGYFAAEGVAFRDLGLFNLDSAWLNDGE